MNIKESLSNFSQNQKKNILYWLSVVAFVNIIIAVQAVYKFASTGLCRNYIILGSNLHSCSAFEFTKNGWAWITYTDVFIFIPAAIMMIMASKIVDTLFAKNEN